MIELRPYQLDAIERIRQAIREGHKRILVVAPTGSGKTILGTQILKGAYYKLKAGLFVAHRREIIHQTADKLKLFGLEDHGTIMAGEERSLMARISVGSIQTIHSRITRVNGHRPDAQVIIYDEAHRSLSKMYQEFAALYPDAILLGLTATPVRGDGAGLGDFYTHMVQVSSVSELTEQGYLVPPIIFAPSMPDLKGVKVRAGDYVEKELGERMDKTSLVGNVAREWSERAHDRQTVVFASTVAHSIHLAQKFQAEGIRAEHIDGTTPKDERDDILRRLDQGDIQVVTNCMVLTEGWDQPSVSCAILVRPTKSYGLYLQMAGRVLRPAPGKLDTYLIDHAGAYYEHGSPLDAGDWTLESGVKIQDRQREKRISDPQPVTCRECFRTWVPSPRERACPSCGWMPTRQAKALNMREGRLVQVDGKKKAKPLPKDKAALWTQCLYIAANRGSKCGAAAHIYRQRTGVWPRKFDNMPARRAEWQMQARDFLELLKDREET